MKIKDLNSFLFFFIVLYFYSIFKNPVSIVVFKFTLFVISVT